MLIERTGRRSWCSSRARYSSEISDLSIATDGNLGYSHSIQHVSGTDMKGQPLNLTVRVTDAYRKINGKWLIIHEHVSVPVDMETGKPDLSSKP